MNYKAFEEHFEECRNRLRGYQRKAPQDMQPKIRLAIKSLDAAEARLLEEKNWGDMLYLLGRFHWMLGFISAQPKDIEEKEEEDASKTPIVDALLRT